MKLMREAGWPELKVGIIAIVALFFLGFLVLKVEHGQGLFSRQAIRAHVKDLRGLRMGAPVQLSGVQVGNARDFDFEPDGSIIVTLGIRRSARPFVKKSSRMTIENLGVLG